MFLRANIPTNQTIIESIVNTIRETISVLDGKLQKMSTKEQMEAINKRHDEEMQRRAQEFKDIREEMKKDSEKREK